MPDVTLGELRLLPCPANERLRHAHPGAGMLTVAAPSGTGGTPAAVTDGALEVGEEHGLPLLRFPLEETAAAHDAVENGAVGKVVIDTA